MSGSRFSTTAAMSVLLATALAGCATTRPPDTNGTRMEAEAGRSSDLASKKGALADQWKRGDKMMSEGNRQVADAQAKAAGASRDLAKYGERTEQAQSAQRQAATLLAQGQDKVAEGRRLKTQAEQQFTFAPSVPAAP
ncbi:hypothetical protein H7F51_13465 [Novosphingobium flavum]|uniref:Lipoprotein n=1 Tax=Novosphingobium flavum TaxID=1778672 RepID=A0A7X1FT95_9SPHN|nr:hypothetical protein [Novosphingobium flavum]MBC2666531.1 hypothetical protein [Novosphingobium flavum]